MKLIKLITLVPLIFHVQIVLAQVSNVEGIKPLEGVTIPKAQVSKEIKPGATFKDCSECPEMVMIPSGSFLMGSSFGYARPLHLVQVQSFAIGKYEVTQEEWKAIMSTNPSSNKGSKLPVENVSWGDAQEFVQLLSQKTGKKYRLPSEAEWEYAARAGSTTLYPWGDNDLEFHAYSWNFRITKSTNPVGIKKPNQFGIYDMLGNVWEWTEDCRHDDYAGAPIDGDAWVEDKCSQRVVRGGSFSSSTSNHSSASREWGTAEYSFWDIGFRVARSN